MGWEATKPKSKAITTKDGWRAAKIRRAIQMILSMILFLKILELQLWSDIGEIWINWRTSDY